MKKRLKSLVTIITFFTIFLSPLYAFDKIEIDRASNPLTVVPEYSASSDLRSELRNYLELQRLPDYKIIVS